MSLSKKTLIQIPLLLILILLVFVIRGCIPIHRGPLSDHFDGTRFYNDEQGHTFTDMLKWLWEMDTVEWPESVVDPTQPEPLAHVGDGDVKITFINHATILIQMDSVNILTDPIWSVRASPLSWFGTKRVRTPGVKLQDLPGIDLILISHDHYDHLDLPTLQELAKRDQPLILCGLGVKSIVESSGITLVRELDWWQSHPVQTTDLKITFVPALHNSGRGLSGANRTLWGGFILEGKSGTIYFAGDTGYGQFLNDVKRQFPEFDLTIFPIGSYEMRWFMKTQHMNPDDAVKAHILLNSRQSLGMHYGTFSEHPEQSIDAHETDIKIALDRYDIPESEFWILQFGEGRYLNQ